MKKVAYDGKHKLADRWEEEPHVLLRQPNKDIPVYEVQKESGEGRKRTLHRNLLLPIGHLTKIDENKNKPIPKPRQKNRTIENPKPVPRKKTSSVVDIATDADTSITE